MSHAYDAVIFDLDGTLFDSAPAMQTISQRVFAELGAPGLSLDEVRSFIGHGARIFFRRALASRGLDDTDRFDERFERFLTCYDESPGGDNAPYPTTFETLAQLAEAGIPLGLCTNKPGQPTANLLAAHDIASLFGVVVAGDSLATKKPDPEPLIFAINSLGATPRTVLFVGDSEVDAATAAAAQTDFALFAKGYRSESIETLAPTYVLNAMDELLPIVLR